MQERAFRFGRARHMIGIAGVPEQRSETPGVIVLNAGLVHRIGPFRLHVELARRLNARGYPTLRFDLSTVGDSAASDESQTREQQVCADVDDAISLLGEQAGCTRFVVIGLCSGAQNAHTVARTDPKVAGVIFLDGYAYRTLGYKLRRYLPKLFNPTSWRRALTQRQRSAEVVAGEPVFSVAPLPMAVVRKDLAGMLARGIKLCLIYSGGISNYFNHARQFRECFGRVVDHPGISTHFFAETDHTYILTGDRRRLIDTIEHWINQQFPVVNTGASS
jgi:pimeloyl-ACP methyl ester carboxylesterase